MLDKAQALAPELIRLRRDFHRHPELSFQEVRTAGIVAETLREIGGIKVQTGIARTGVVGELGSGDGPTIAIRADMDALPILEKNEVPYASTYPGVMHACGHDAHIAILLGAAHLLKDSFAANGLKGKVRFIFQPAEEAEDEEGKSGGLRMVEEQVMAGVEAIIALHMDADSPARTVIRQSGWCSAAVDSFKAWITATGGHGASPHKGTDPIWMLGPILTALHGIVSRRVDPAYSAVVTIGEVHAGTASNIIPHEAYLHGTLRSYDNGVRQLLLDEVEKALSLARPLGGDYRLEVVHGYPPGWNDPIVSQWLTTVSTDLLGQSALLSEPPGMGAEDFAYMCQAAPGAMIFVGSAMAEGLYPGRNGPPLFDR